jgi:hypothetical protein
MCTGLSIRFVGCRHVGYRFSTICRVIGCFDAQGFLHLEPYAGFCPNCSPSHGPLRQNLDGFHFEYPQVATLRVQAHSFLHYFDEARDKGNRKEERIQQLEMTINQLSGRHPGNEAGSSVEKEGSEAEEQQIGTGGDQTQYITPNISELHSPRALKAAFEALRNDLNDREEFWVEHIRAIEKELKMAFGTVSWAEVILTKEELDKLNCFRQSENLGTSKRE